MRGDDRNICRHAGLQFLVGITHANDRVVGYHVLHGDRRVAHLSYFSLEGAGRKRVDRELHILIHRDSAHVRLRHVGVDLHFREIVRDRKNDRRLQTRRDGLTDIDVSRNHDPIDGRRDRAMVEVRFHFLERAFLDLHVRFRLVQVRGRLVEIRLRGILFRDQRPGASFIELRELQGGVRIGEIAFRLVHARLENHRVDLRDDLPGFHDRIKIDEQLLDVPRHLAAYLDVLDRI